MQIGNLYPKIQFPVSRGTPYISHLLKWNHDSSWYVMNYKEWIDIFFGYKVVNLNAKDVEWTFVTGHVIDGLYFSQSFSKKLICFCFRSKSFSRNWLSGINLEPPCEHG